MHEVPDLSFFMLRFKRLSKIPVAFRQVLARGDL